MDSQEHPHGRCAQESRAQGSSAQIIRWRPREAPSRAPPAGTVLPCHACSSRSRCLPGQLGEAALQELDGRAGRRKVHAGAPLFLEGDKCTHVYVVRSGGFKSALTLRDGREQVTTFAMPGDMLGLDGLGPRVHATTATALEDAEVCSIPAAALHELALHNSNWQDLLCRLLGLEILRDHRHAVLLGHAGTDARLAAFLLELSRQLRERGYSDSEFHMRMSRAEIGSYVGLTLETVSRTLSSFQARGLLQVRKRHIRIVQRPALQQMVENEGL